MVLHYISQKRRCVKISSTDMRKRSRLSDIKFIEHFYKRIYKKSLGTVKELIFISDLSKSCAKLILNNFLEI